MRKKIAQPKSVYICGMEKRRFLKITPKGKSKFTDNKTKAIVRLSHYVWENLISSATYNEIKNNMVLTILSFEQFGNLIGALISSDKCINLKAFHKNKNFPDKADLNNLYRKAKKYKDGLFKWGVGMDGEPQLLFTDDRRIVFAINGELKVNPGFYNFKTNYAGAWLQLKHKRKIELVKFRLEMAHKTPVHKKLPTIVDIKQTIYANEETTTTEKRENRGE